VGPRDAVMAGVSGAGRCRGRALPGTGALPGRVACRGCGVHVAPAIPWSSARSWALAAQWRPRAHWLEHVIMHLITEWLARQDG